MLFKVCGITNMDDALLSRDQGADLIGVVLSEKSPRKGTPQLIRDLVDQGYETVAVYTSTEDALRMGGAEKYAQIHYRAEIDDILKIGMDGRKIIGVVDIDSEDYVSYYNKIRRHCHMVLLESRKGISARMEEISPLLGGKTGVAGKIGEGNIDVIMKYNPYLVDLSSSLESYPGKKDPERVRSFFRRIKNEIPH